jgi:uncharacterized protein (TIGR03437 family)
VAVDALGNIYVADSVNGRIRKVDGTGAITTFAGGGQSTADGVSATSASLNMPLGVAVDSGGNVYIAEFAGNRVRVVNAAGNISTIAGNGLQGFSGDGGIATNASLYNPTDVKVDSMGNVYIADSLNSSIRKLAPATVAPLPSITSIVNAASFANGPVSPGENVVLTGTALGPNSQVFFDTVAAPVLASSFTSTLAVVPYEVAAKTSSQVTVVTAGVTSAAFTVQIASSAPGIYTTSGTGTGQAIAFLQDGTTNSANNPVQDGQGITILCTGEGLLTPAVATGVPIGLSPPSPVLSLTATVDGQPAQVTQSYSVPGALGQLLVQVIPPNGVADQAAQIQIMIGNGMTQVAQISVTTPPDDGSGSSGDYLKKRRGAGPKPANPSAKP